MNVYVYMLGAKYEFAQSMVCAAQTMDPYLCAGNPWIAFPCRTLAVRLECNAQSVHVHGLYKPAS